MERNHSGRIINIASGLAFKGSPGLIHYAASKGAVVNLTRSMAQGSGEGINVNSLAPGGTASSRVLERRPSSSQASERVRQERILKRAELPEGLLGTLIYLSSAASEFLTGQTILVDGGAYLH